MSQTSSLNCSEDRSALERPREREARLRRAGQCLLVTEPSVLERGSPGEALVVAPRLAGFSLHRKRAASFQISTGRCDRARHPGLATARPTSLARPPPHRPAWTQEGELGEAGLLSAPRCVPSL